MTNLATIQMAEFYVSSQGLFVSASQLHLKELKFETYDGNIIAADFATVTFSKVRGKDLIKVSALYYKGSPISPDDVKLLADLKITTSDGSPIELTEVKSVLIFGNDHFGYSIVKQAKVLEKAPFLAKKAVEYRHLVVTGVHGNFKDVKQARKRASHYKDAKVIRIHA